MLEERKRKAENPGLIGGITAAQEVGEAGCFKVNEEEICLFREVVRLTYQKPEAIVTVLNCMFNRNCPKGAPGAQTAQGQKDERQKMLEQVKSTMADQGFTPDSPGGQSRLQAATTQILDAQRTNLQAGTSETLGTGPSTSSAVPTATKDPRTEAIIQNSSITFETDFRQIFITDTLDRIYQMKKVIRILDVPVPQVLIESRIVQGSKDWGRTLGVMWGGRNNQYGTIENDKRAFWGFTGNQGRATYTQPSASDPSGSQLSVPPGGVGAANTPTGSGIFNTLPQPPPIGTTPIGSPVDTCGPCVPPLNIPSTYAVNLPAPLLLATRIPGLLPDPVGLGLQFGLLGAKYITELDARIQLGEAQSTLKQIARPKIQVVDREEASILRGTQIPYQSSSANQGTQVQFVDAVLELKVTPTIYSDGRVQMKIDVKDDYPDRILNGQVSIGKRRAKTIMIVKDGETCVIGGVLREDKLDHKAGWPGLMNMPLIGYLFSNKKSEKGADELFIFITPNIIKRPPNAS